jgi:hypothetical protein
VRLAIDWTSEGDQHLLVISLLVGRRALPIFWRAYSQSALKGRMKRYELAIIKSAFKLIFRVKGSVKVFYRGEWVKLNTIRFEGNRRRRNLGRLYYCEKSPRQLWVTMSRARNKKGNLETWYLVSNLKLRAEPMAKEYGFRFCCEEGFCDAKSPFDHAPNPYDKLLKKERADIVRQVISEMRSDRDRQILHRFFITEDDKEKICADLRLTSLHLAMAMGQEETPRKAAPWIKRKYFTTRGGDHWVFFGELKRKDGTRRQIFLFNAASVRIRRHCKIKGAANPYDPTMETYFERRPDAQMSATLRGHQQLLSLWKKQEGRCLVCQQPITRVTGWHRHHLKGR